MALIIIIQVAKLVVLLQLLLISIVVITILIKTIKTLSTVCKMLLTELSLSWLWQEEKLHFKESNSKMNSMTPERLDTWQELYCLPREIKM